MLIFYYIKNSTLPEEKTKTLLNFICIDKSTNYYWVSIENIFGLFLSILH